MGASGSGNVGADESVEDLRDVMVGKTGNGKSATGNSILGREAFISKMQPTSITARCAKATGILPDGRTLAVIDTPGFFDTKYTQLQTIEEVKKCVSFCSPGPHVIIQVIRLGHFSQEEMEVAKLIKDVFSLNAKEYMVLLFTRKEDLEGRPLQEMLSEDDKSLAALREQIKSCGNRCLAFNNNAEGKEQQDQVDDSDGRRPRAKELAEILLHQRDAGGGQEEGAWMAMYPPLIPEGLPHRWRPWETMPFKHTCIRVDSHGFPWLLHPQRFPFNKPVDFVFSLKRFRFSSQKLPQILRMIRGWETGPLQGKTQGRPRCLF